MSASTTATTASASDAQPADTQTTQPDSQSSVPPLRLRHGVEVYFLKRGSGLAVTPYSCVHLFYYAAVAPASKAASRKNKRVRGMYYGGEGSSSSEDDEMRVQGSDDTAEGASVAQPVAVGSGPVTVVLGNGSLLPGLEMALLHMHVDDQARVIVPPTMAYGVYGCGDDRVPQRAPITYDITVRNVEPEIDVSTNKNRMVTKYVTKSAAPGASRPVMGQTVHVFMQLQGDKPSKPQNLQFQIGSGEQRAELDAAVLSMCKDELATVNFADGCVAYLMCLREFEDTKDAVTMSHVQRLREEGNESFNSKHYDQAISKYQICAKMLATASNFSSEASYVQLGATDVLGQIYGNLTQVYLSKQAYPEAEQMATLSTQFAPNIAKNHFRRAKARRFLGQYQEALDDIEKAIQLSTTPEQQKEAFQQRESIMKLMQQQTQSSI